jgi:hypothetical protein
MNNKVHPNDSRLYASDFEKLNDPNKNFHPPFMSSTMKTPNSVEVTPLTLVEQNKIKYLDLYN